MQGTQATQIARAIGLIHTLYFGTRKKHLKGKWQQKFIFARSFEID